MHGHRPPNAPPFPLCSLSVRPTPIPPPAAGATHWPYTLKALTRVELWAVEIVAGGGLAVEATKAIMTGKGHYGGGGSVAR